MCCVPIFLKQIIHFISRAAVVAWSLLVSTSFTVVFGVFKKHYTRVGYNGFCGYLLTLLCTQYTLCSGYKWNELWQYMRKYGFVLFFEFGFVLFNSELNEAFCFGFHFRHSSGFAKPN